MSVRPIRNLRWWIGGMLFLSTIINYLDRQTLSLLAPFLKLDYHWTNTDYANILIGFRVGYSLGQTVLGRMIDRIGTRRGLSITVVLYSLVASATSLARGLYSFATFRTLLGIAESANWPGASKAVSEWFPKRERALAIVSAHTPAGRVPDPLAGNAIEPGTRDMYKEMRLLLDNEEYENFVAAATRLSKSQFRAGIPPGVVGGAVGGVVGRR